METRRQSKIARLLQKELAEIFRQKQVSYNNAIITVTVVRISPDLSVAKIFLSIFSPKMKQEDIMEDIKLRVQSLRAQLGKNLRYQLMKIPELVFHIDDSLDYVEKIDRLLKK